MRGILTPPRKRPSCSGISAGRSAARWARRRPSSWMFRIAISTTETSSTASTWIPPPFSRRLSTASFEAPQNRLRISPRIDYQLSQNNTLTVRYGYTRNDLQDQGVGNLSLLSRAYPRLGHRPHRANYRNRRSQHQGDQRNAVPVVSHRRRSDWPATICRALPWPARLMAAARRWDTTPTPKIITSCRTTPRFPAGAHTWKFGVRVRAVTINNFSPQNFGGTYFFNGAYAPILDANNQPVAPGVQCDQANPNPAACSLLQSIQVYQRTLAFCSRWA